MESSSTISKISSDKLSAIPGKSSEGPNSKAELHYGAGTLSVCVNVRTHDGTSRCSIPIMKQVTKKRQLSEPQFGMAAFSSQEVDIEIKKSQASEVMQSEEYSHLHKGHSLIDNGVN